MRILPWKRLAATMILAAGLLQPAVAQRAASRKVILLEEIPATVSCGNIAFAIALKLREINEPDSAKVIIGIVRCPDMYGPNYFTKSATFTVDLSTDTTALKPYTVYNVYRDLRKPTFLITKLKKE